MRLRGAVDTKDLGSLETNQKAFRYPNYTSLNMAILVKLLLILGADRRNVLV